MVKKVQSALLIILLFHVFTPIEASNYSVANDSLVSAFFCDAPAPDSFLVISRGPDFIELGWNPAWIGATHTLIAFTNTNTNGGTTWTVLDTFYNVIGTSYTVNGIPFETHCRFLLATNCASGEAGNGVVLEPSKVILELETSGRIPIDPVVVSCSDIDLNEHEWVGFRVKHKNGNPFELNIFELIITEDPIYYHIKIKRSSDLTNIYASNDQYIWPDPTRFPPNPFKIVKYNPGNPFVDIGRVGVTINFSNFHAKLCQALNPIWNQQYDYDVLVADHAKAGSAGNVDLDGRNQSDTMVYSNTKFRVLSPFNDVLSIFASGLNHIEREVTIKLFNINAQILLDEKITANTYGNIAIPVNSLGAGMYILRLELENENQIFRIIKL
jgi:hypothetical protein